VNYFADNLLVSLVSHTAKIATQISERAARMPRKKNIVAKIGKQAVSFAGDGENSARRLITSKPRHAEPGAGASARGPPSGLLDQLLTVQEVAALLRCSVSSLNKWRLTGIGPRFVYVGSRVRYRGADVATFIRECTRTSTSQQEASPAA
jgi:Helix-turn-helix domain